MKCEGNSSIILSPKRKRLLKSKYGAWAPIRQLFNGGSN
ncbi:hypothetical protein VEA_001338 [Vibrio antiquarius]|uniref:Uncharacterized protein n=1 Tax=Vibrio antiquarius (strain Ex25) TaxID=150340 RepID=A0ACA6QTQ0_VIBAE|nr:hypothetical protein VEA_001338 [Vibrio antiquarius]